MKIKFLLITLMATAAAQAQTYYPTLQSGVVWQINYIGAAGYGSSTVRTLGDSVVGGVTYEKVNDGSPISLYREDTAGQEIYYRSPSGQETLLYDFALNMGDSVVISWFDSYLLEYENFTFYVDSVSQTAIQSGSRKLLRLHCNGCDQPSLYWLESVGNLYNLGPLSYNSEGIDYPTDTITCQQINGAQTFLLSDSTPCNLTSGIDDLSGSAMQLSFYPNPVQNSITLSASELITNVEIINMTGQVVSSNQYHATMVNVDMAAFPAGVYIMQANGQAYRIVKE